jgi:hypothetical protein
MFTYLYGAKVASVTKRPQQGNESDQFFLMFLGLCIGKNYLAHFE